MRKLFLLFILSIFCISISFSQIISTPSGGNWSDNATWVGGIIPTATDAVIIADGAVVTVDVAADALSLEVGQGTSGTLTFDALNAQTLSVASDVTISSGGIFQADNAGAQNGHTLIVGGNLTNNGTLDFSSNAGASGIQIAFTGAANATFSGNGAVTDIYRIIVNKGTDVTSILELNTTAFSFEGATTTAGSDPGFLTLLNGMFKISGTFSMENGLFTGINNYTVPPSAGIWFNNPNYTVAARNGTAYIEGTLIMDAGILNVGTDIDNRLGYIDGSVITINGGIINVASRFSATTTFGVQYTQTGGTLNVNTVGSSSSTYASFDIRDIDVSSFTMSGGNIVLQNPSAGGAGPRDFQNRPAIVNITGGNLIIGNNNTAAAQTFYLQGVAPNLVLSNSPGGHTARLFNNLEVKLNTSIPAGSTLQLDDGTTGYQYTQTGASFVNSGTLNATVAGSRLLFAGAGVPQTYSGDGTVVTPIESFEINNTAGLTLANTIASEINCNELVMTAGDINTGIHTMVIGTGTATPGTLVYSSGTIVGKLKRWIDAVTGNTNFPVGISGITRNAAIDFTSAPATGGTLTAEWIASPGGDNGLPLIDGVYLVTNTSSEGYWNMTAGDGLNGGIYTGTFNANGLVTITDFSQLVLVKRANNAAPWVLDGTHVITTGSNSAAVLSRTGMAGFSDFGIGGNITSLPVSIEYFRGTKQATGHLLNWKVNCVGSPTAILTLERSGNSRDFSVINNITATALRCLQPFNYSDLSPLPGINYYRVKMTDADGRSNYSSIIALLNNTRGFEITSVQPNPVISNASLNIASASKENASLVITDMTGRRLLQKNINLVAGSNQVFLDMSGYPSGVYSVVVVNAAGEKRTVSVVKQ
ncbi:MAG: T9SS type A sorting domain-containing protein [Ferruginibacter sp.]